MSSFKYYLSPNDPNGVYVLSSICAEVGAVGSLVASFIREWINSANSNYDTQGCTSEAIKAFDTKCLSVLFGGRGKGLWWFQFSHSIIMLFGLITCIPFYGMEDLFNDHEGAPFMRSCLVAGTVLEIMSSAFKVGVRTAGGVTAKFFKPVESPHKIDPYPAMNIGYSMFSSSFTWVTFFRDAILAIGVYLATVYDSQLNVIGGTWRTFGWITVCIGIINTIFEFLKVINFDFFYNKSDFTYYCFLLSYTVWLFLFGMHCKSLTVESKGMLDGEDETSGSEVDDAEEAPEATRVSDAEEEEENGDEEEAKKVHRKKRHHHKKVESSDDDV